MKEYIKRYIGLACALLAVGCFASCKNGETVDTPTESYVYHASDETTAAQGGENTSSEAAEIQVDTSWKDNFDVSYTYFNAAQSKDTVSVREKRSENYFSAEDTASGDMLFYAGGSLKVDSYVIVPGEEEQVHSVIKDKTLDDLSSTFMKLSDVDKDLPSLSNVMYMYDEEIAGRKCAKYIQRSYTEGENTGTAYIWIDSQYGFAACGEVYDKDMQLTASWKVTSFAAGDVTDEDVKIDLSGYKIVEE